MPHRALNQLLDWPERPFVFRHCGSPLQPRATGLVVLPHPVTFYCIPQADTIVSGAFSNLANTASCNQIGPLVTHPRIHVSWVKLVLLGSHHPHGLVLRPSLDCMAFIIDALELPPSLCLFQCVCSGIFHILTCFTCPPFALSHSPPS